MNLSREDILCIAKQTRLKLEDKEVDRLQEQISRLLDYFSTLAEVNTENTEPSYQPFYDENVMSQDTVSPSLSCQTVLLNAPDCDGENFKVKAVLE